MENESNFINNYHEEKLEELQSTIDKGSVIRNIIQMLPQEYHKTTTTEKDLMEIDKIQNFSKNSCKS